MIERHKKSRSTPEKWIIAFVACTVLLVMCGSTTHTGERVAIPTSINADVVTELYTVQSGDTLLGIAEKFIVKNTHGQRNLTEFAEGIRESNPRAFVNGQYVRAGEVLTIRYFVRR